MISVRIVGGLGNQMFQYAAGWVLSHRNKDVLALDTTAFETRGGRETVRQFGLSEFQISAKILSQDEARLRRNPYGELSRVHRFVEQKIRRKYYVGWHPNVMKRSGEVYLEGYFQSEEYFKEYVGDIREQFKLRVPVADGIAHIKALIRENGSPVALHVRRGDYVDRPEVAKLHHVCSVNYYSRAIDIVKTSVDNGHFVVFSDDAPWVKQNIPGLEGATWISDLSSADGRSLTPAEELSLIAACDHAIISNSTFSWWGAYLLPSPSKLVIAPSRWTNSLKFEHASILPSGWIRVNP